MHLRTILGNFPIEGAILKTLVSLLKKPFIWRSSAYLTAGPSVNQNLNRGSTPKSSMKANKRISFQDTS